MNIQVSYGGCWGLHGLCFGLENLRQLHNQSHRNPKQLRLGHLCSPVSMVPCGILFCSNRLFSLFSVGCCEYFDLTLKFGHFKVTLFATLLLQWLLI